MSVLFPDGALSGDLPDSDADEEVRRDGSARILFITAGAYQAAQYALATRTARLTRDLWQQARPVNDVALGEWMSAWDRLMGQSAAQQVRLTESYVRTSLRQFGISVEPLSLAEPPPQAATVVADWLDSDYADLDQNLHDEAEALLARLRGNQASLTDLARADRLPWLHSPVIKVRTELAEGRNVDAVFDEITAGLDVSVDAALRTNEFDAMSTVNWPRFKNGKAAVAKRIPQAGACGWCRVVATRLYALDSMKREGAWHNGCRCVWGMATEAEARTYSDVLRKTQGEGGAGLSEGNYYKAAQAIGLWEGSTDHRSFAPVVGERFDPAAAYEGAGYVSTRTARTGATQAYDPASGEYRTIGSEADG